MSTDISVERNIPIATIVIDVDDDLKVIDDFYLKKYFLERYIVNGVDVEYLRYAKGYRYPISSANIGKYTKISTEPFHAVYSVDIFIEILKYTLAKYSNNPELFYKNPMLKNNGTSLISYSCNSMQSIQDNILNSIDITSIYDANIVYSNLVVHTDDISIIIKDMVPEIDNEVLPNVAKMFSTLVNYVIDTYKLEQYSNNILIFNTDEGSNITIEIGKDIGMYRLEEVMSTTEDNIRVGSITESKSKDNDDKNNELRNSISVFINNLLKAYNSKVTSLRSNRYDTDRVLLTNQDIDNIVLAIYKYVADIPDAIYGSNNMLTSNSRIFMYIPTETYYKFNTILNTILIYCTDDTIYKLIDLIKYIYITRDNVINMLYRNGNILVDTITTIYNVGGSVELLKSVQNKLRTVNVVLSRFNFDTIRIPYDYDI
jgi:hypothetical protein